jgi:hypothetical protein
MIALFVTFWKDHGLGLQSVAISAVFLSNTFPSDACIVNLARMTRAGCPSPERVCNGLYRWNSSVVSPITAFARQPTPTLTDEHRHGFTIRSRAFGNKINTGHHVLA